MRTEKNFSKAIHEKIYITEHESAVKKKNQLPYTEKVIFIYN